MKILGLIAGAAMFLGAHSAYAVTITNGDFEAPGGTTGSGFTTLTPVTQGLNGWTIGGDSIDYIDTYWAGQGPSGHSVDLNGNNVGSIEQTVSNLVIGQQYTLSFYLSATPGYGDQTIGVTFGTAGKSYTLSDTGAINWAVQTFVFVANSTSALLKFAGSSNPINNHAGMALDSVTIAATPIPGAILLFGSALSGMGFLGFRRKKLDAAA